MTKKFFKTGIQPLLTGWDAPAGCFASDRIMVDGCPIGYMYREMPDDDTEFSRSDSGWRFFAGDENDEYMDNPDNFDIYHLNTVCNYAPDILPLLSSDYGTAFARNETGIFERENLEIQED